MVNFVAVRPKHAGCRGYLKSFVRFEEFVDLCRVAGLHGQF